MLVHLALDRMTLLLGPPSSGKSTLLRVLAGKLDGELKVSMQQSKHIIYYCTKKKKKTAGLNPSACPVPEFKVTKTIVM